MKISLTQKSITEIDTARLPTVEHVFIPTITSSIDIESSQEITVSIDIDGTIYYNIYDDTETVPSDVETLKSEATTINTTKDTNETVDISVLSSGDYTFAVYAENDYGDGTEIETTSFTIE